MSKKVAKKLKKVVRVQVKSKIAKRQVIKGKAKRMVAVKAKRVVKKMTITKVKPLKPQAKIERPSIALNAPTTKEQQAGIPSVVTTDSFEGVRKIDHLPLTEQIDTVFNPLHTITKTTVTDAVSDSTFIVSPTPVPQG